MSRVFADTFYFLTLANPKDAAHSRAVAAALAIDGELVTTAWVLTEFADAMCAPVNRTEFIAILEDLRLNPQVRILPADIALFEAGIDFYRNRLDKDWPLTDCISFVVTQTEDITEALTGDKHFEQAGFTALLK
jgi:hypothetical protein